jgi:hypothetical protein
MLDSFPDIVAARSNQLGATTRFRGTGSEFAHDLRISGSIAVQERVCAGIGLFTQVPSTDIGPEPKKSLILNIELNAH